jgi:anti-anti-sigma factor
VRVSSYAQADTWRISIHGRFDFSIAKDFRSAYEAASVAMYVVDLSAAEYIDSSGLGMLLVLHEWAVKRGSRMSIVNPSPSARKLLELAHLTKILAVG